jgi:glycosyltransferase involved in cell wall biosynthesis
MSDQEHPSVSVVIATRDRPELLRAALRAVFDQDYPGSIDAVVVCDQSDIDPALVDEFPNDSIRVISNDHTTGLAGARNSGVEAAGGEWIAFCDDDDEWLPTKLSAQFAMLEQYPAARTLATGVVVLYEDDEFPRVPEHDLLTFEQLLRNRVMDAHPSSVAVHRATLVNTIGLVDEEIPGSYAEDYEWILRAARVSDIAVATRPLVRVRWHSASFFSDRWQMIVAAIDYLLEKVPEFEHEPRGRARLLGRQAFGLAALGQNKAAFAKIKDTIQANWRERRAYVATLVAIGVISPGRAMAWAHSRGRGI